MDRHYSFAKVRQPVQEKKSTEFKLALLLLKTDLVSYPIRNGCNILIYVEYTDTWNVHMHRNPEIRETLTTLGSSGTKLLLPSWLLGFRHEERETHNFYYVPSDPTTHGALCRPDWPRLAEARKSTRFAQFRILTNCFF